MDNNQGGPGEDGAQGEPAEPEDADKSRTYASRNGEPEPETPVVNGEKETSKGEPGTDEIRTSDEVGDRDHRRPQEKKKAKGLGEQRAATGEVGMFGLTCCPRIQRKLLSGAPSHISLIQARGVDRRTEGCRWDPVSANTISNLLCKLGQDLSPFCSLVFVSLQ